MEFTLNFVFFLVFGGILIFCILRYVWIEIFRDEFVIMGYVVD